MRKYRPVETLDMLCAVCRRRDISHVVFGVDTYYNFIKEYKNKRDFYKRKGITSLFINGKILLPINWFPEDGWLAVRKGVHEDVDIMIHAVLCEDYDLAEEMMTEIVERADEYKHVYVGAWGDDDDEATEE